MRYDKPVTLIRVKNLGNATVWGLNINDFKAYGTYANVDPTRMTLSPYVNVAYKQPLWLMTLNKQKQLSMIIPTQ